MVTEEDKKRIIDEWFEINGLCLLMDAYYEIRKAREAKGSKLTQQECFEAAGGLLFDQHKKFRYQVRQGLFDVGLESGDANLIDTLGRIMADAQTYANIGDAAQGRGATIVMANRAESIGAKDPQAALDYVETILSFEKASLGFVAASMSQGLHEKGE